VNLSISAGEVVGLTGLTGMGHEEIPYLLAGARVPRSGRVVLPDGRTLVGGPREAKRHAIVLIPGNRAKEGAWLDATSTENLSLPVLSRYFRNGFLQQRVELADAYKMIEQYDVRPRTPNRPMSKLSGGNQQKVVLAKWLRDEPRVVLMDEPTQGVDVGAKYDILELIRATANRGAGVLIASSDEEQLAGVCNRVEIFNHGRITATLTGDDITPDRIVQLCYTAG
jgi:ribose transport system ATP-binding protein